MATEGRSRRREIVSGYAAIAVMQASQPGDFFGLQRIGGERSGVKCAIVAGFGLIWCHTLIRLVWSSRVVEGFELTEQPIEMAVADRNDVRQKLFLQRSVEPLNRTVLPGTFDGSSHKNQRGQAQ